MHLDRELGTFVKSRATMFVKAPLEPKKAIGLLLHGVNANIIVDKFNVEVFTMRKYVDIVIKCFNF